MQINIYIPKGSEDVLNLHFIDKNEMEAVAEEPEQAEPDPEAPKPKIIRDPTPCGPHPEGSPEALAAIERVRTREAEKKELAGKKRGRKKKEDE